MQHQTSRRSFLLEAAGATAFLPAAAAPLGKFSSLMAVSTEPLYSDHVGEIPRKASCPRTRTPIQTRTG